MNTVSELVENYNGCKCSGGGGGDTEYVEVTFQLEEGLTEALVSGFFVFDYGQEGEYSESYFTLQNGNTVTVHMPLYNGSGAVYAQTDSYSSCWFEGDNITEQGVLTGGGTVTIHESTD